MAGQPNLFEPEQDNSGLSYWENKCITELRAEIQRDREKGCQCKICDQNVKLYKRKLNSGMAAALYWMVNFNDGNWIDIPATAPRFILRTKEYGTLRHWGLVLQCPNNDDPTKKNSGLWKPTLTGIQFVTGILEVPKYIYLYNNEVEGSSDEQTKIQEALGDKFDYEKLMRGE